MEASKEVGSHMKIKNNGNKIRVLGKDYEVKYIKGLADFGSTDFNNQIILIKEDMTDENKQSVILHEILEVINEATDMNLKHQDIQTLEAGLFSVYKDNF